MEPTEREQWATKIGLILAMAGNAVGLGNFVRFPTLVAGNGGGAFMVPYFAALFLLGIPIMWVEWVTGRYGGKYGHGTLGPAFYLMARESLKPRRALVFGIIGGMLAFACVTLLNSFYIPIIGWSAAYTYFSAAGSYWHHNTATFFGNFMSNHPERFLFWGITIVLLAIAVGRGVSKGIERWVSVMMPLLYAFAIILVIYVFVNRTPVTPNWSTIKGFDFIWTPNWAYLKEHFSTVMLAAAGQIFFTLSIGMGIIQNYASYLGPEDDVAVSGVATVSLNEFAEVVLGGSMAIPLATAYFTKIVTPGLVAKAFKSSSSTLQALGVPSSITTSGNVTAIKNYLATSTHWSTAMHYLSTHTSTGMKVISSNFGLGFSYASLPNAFIHMGTAGRFFGTIWFLLLWFAGFTSAIAMYNYLVALFEEDAHIKRSVGTWLVLFIYFILTLPVIYIAGYMDQLNNWISFQLTLLGLFDIIVAVWLFKPSNFWKELHKGAYVRVPTVYKWITIIVAPIFLMIPLVGTFKSFVTGALGPAAGAAIIIMFIIGAAETYYAIKRKYGEELEKNEVVIKV